MLMAMLTTHKHNKANEEGASDDGLVGAALDKLCALINSARLEILVKLQRVEDSVEILARQMRREVDEE